MQPEQLRYREKAIEPPCTRPLSSVKQTGKLGAERLPELAASGRIVLRKPLHVLDKGRNGHQERGLADAALAGQDDDLGPAGQQTLEFLLVGFPTDEVVADYRLQAVGLKRRRRFRHGLRIGRSDSESRQVGSTWLHHYPKSRQWDFGDILLSAAGPTRGRLA